MDKEEKKMAIRKEDLNDTKKKLDRKQLIRSVTKQACRENDEGLRRLSKN